MTRAEWEAWYDELSPRERRECVADMGEQVDMLHQIRLALTNCEEFGDELDFEHIKGLAWGE